MANPSPGSSPESSSPRLVAQPSVEDIRQVLATTAENHPFRADALGVEYADWCGTGAYGVFCTWQPSWRSLNDLDDAREQHTEHLVEEQAHAVAILLGHPLDPETDYSPNMPYSQRYPKTT